MVSSGPKVWTRFERSVDGCVKKFKVQEVPVEFYDDVINFMVVNFLHEEPLSIATGVLNNPVDRELVKKFWKEVVLPDKLSLMCLEDTEEPDAQKEIVGVNFLIHNTKEKHEKEEDKEIPKIFHVLKEIYSRFNIFEEYSITEYLDAAGLCVNKNYRGMNIGGEILLARTPLAKEKGLKVTETIFTSIASQKLAKKSGFTTLVEIEFVDLEKIFDIKFPNQFKTLKVMTKKF